MALNGTKNKLNRVEREQAIVQARFSHVTQEYFKWTQPTGTVHVWRGRNKGFLSDTYIFNISFTFTDGIQRKQHPFPGKPYKGGTFFGNLSCGAKGQLLCKMLKLAFRRGVMFILGEEGKVELNSVSLYEGPVYDYIWRNISADYVRYEQTLKAELAAKGITETSIDQTGDLLETFAVDGLSFLEDALSSEI